KRREFILLGGDSTAERFFKSRGIAISSQLDALDPAKHTIIIWDATRVTRAEKEQSEIIDRFLRAGGSMVVLSASAWDWPELCDVKLYNKPRFSRAFTYKGARKSPLADIDSETLIRWNGFPGTVATGNIEASAVAEKLLWAKEPNTIVMAFIPSAS